MSAHLLSLLFPLMIGVLCVPALYIVGAPPMAWAVAWIGLIYIIYNTQKALDMYRKDRE